MDANIKDIVKQEYIKCVQDPNHFVKKYCYIQHPIKGRIPFNLFPFQEKVNSLFNNKNEKYIIINKCRQLGISTLIASYALWLMLFHKDKNVLVIATKQETAKNMITKVQFMYENLPLWLRLPIINNNKLSLKLSNGSQIKAVSAASDSGRSEAVSLLIIDEAAFIEDIEDIFISAQQTLATGGSCIVVSTPKGVGNWFHKTFVEGEMGVNGFTSVKLPWYLHPEKNQEWRDEQDKLLGKKAALQENDCNFEASGDTVIDAEILAFYETNYVEDPKEMRGIAGDFWIWKYPDPARTYLVAADTARGDDKDFSTFHIIDIINFEQVAEFKSKIQTRDFARVLMAAGMEWNNALLVIENSSVGWDVVQTVLESQYPNVYFSPKNFGDLTPEKYIGKYDTGQTTPGFTNSTKTRPLVVAKLKSSLHDKSFVFHSKRFLSELRTFVWTDSGKPEALRGYNDDLCMASGIACFVRDISLRFDQYNRDLSYASVGGITKVQPYNKNIPPLKGGNNPWTMQVGKDSYDITWLI